MVGCICKLLEQWLGLSSSLGSTLLSGIGALVSSWLLTLFLGPFFIKMLSCYRVSLLEDRPYCGTLNQLHAHKKATPIMGGLLILLSITMSCIFWGGTHNIYNGLLLVILCSGGIVGFFDDRKKVKYQNAGGITPLKKFLVQFFMGGVVAFFTLVSPGEQVLQESGDIAYRVKNISSFFHQPEFLLQLPCYPYPVKILGYFGVLIGVIFIIFVLTGSSNAVNLTDGLDGLAAGVVVLSAIPLMHASYLSHLKITAIGINFLYGSPYEAAFIMLGAIIGACLGFLRYNTCPAKVFMGDCGSLPLGAVLGASAIIIKQELLLAIVGIVFLIEVLSVILQILSMRYRKKRIFLCAPIHHHFEYKGLSEKSIVMRFWVIGGVAAFIGLIILKISF
ncbi:Phospho-N-acetylmuramoyl-pentapeptide-transferas e [Candidatus Clavichlamydia salmonicola]|uniref:phospho-N-acetylmuramoyl-pentapeptide- transferase n=1 Tax=Candidatus Clavichlamydia salmonicola TaxID=469812 RepID=UPI001890EF5E|nr:phospho-N-acetylmuramoyl-pentapeptide-transferase [Candidatus Clavichlamydia salmonicola]MBF5050499.1 Phospho-N-acetylmuramoyl-pentapeptide-transferas e [Candidatus Clavichlamydia salmonicola]